MPRKGSKTDAIRSLLCSDMRNDGNRGITGVSYDYGHHPYSITISTNQSRINNDYTPDGRKLSSQHVAYIRNEKGTGNIRIATSDLYVDGLVLRGGKPLLWQFDGGYVSLDANGAPTGWNYYVTDHLGSTRMVVGSDNSVKETISYYPFGSEMRMQAPAQMGGDTRHPFRFTGKELDRQNGLNWYDFGARWYDVAGVPMWTSVDPLAEENPWVSPYMYCAGDPANRIDPDGKDWYQNDDFHYYTWFEGDGYRKGFTHIGGKGCILGEFEFKISDILIDVYKNNDGLYSEGRTIDITDVEKGAILPSDLMKMNDFLDEFVFGYGPEISILTADHPYTKALQTDDKVIESQQILRSGKTDISGQITKVKREWNLWDLISTPSMAKQFVGSYSFDSYTSNDGKHLLNIIYDTKSFRSLFYHIPGTGYLNHSRNSSVKPLSTTYQFYIWKARK